MIVDGDREDPTGSIRRELSIEYSAYEFGLDRFVHPNKGDFLGRDALVAWREHGLTMDRSSRWRCDGVTDADARGSEPIYRDGELVGRATNGGYGLRIGKSLALAMVRPDHAADGTALEITILGRLYRATVIAESPFDPDNNALRADA